MKICSSCQKELIDEAKFCSECGTPTEEKKKFCEKCGNLLQENAKFCIECGNGVYDEISPEVNLEETVEALSAQENEMPKAEEKAPKRSSKSNSVLSLSFAIPSLVCAVLCASSILETVFIYFPLMLVFWVLSKSFIREYYKQEDSINGYIKASSVLTKVALPVGLVFSALSICSQILSFLLSPTFVTLVENFISFFNETAFELLAK